MDENKALAQNPIEPVFETSPLPPTNKKSLLTGAWEFVRFLIIVGLTVFAVRYFVAQPFKVSGTSMVPTFADRNYLIIDELSYRFSSPHRGDVIVFHPPIDPTTYYIKRVIGLPGETVIIKNSVISIVNKEYPDGKVLTEDYITKDAPDDNFSITIPDDQYFVMGDNRPASFDSRRWGLLPKKNITGRVFLRLFPINEMGIFPGEHNIY